jgi:DNA-binding SARP family transcriptional activator/uncharacterized protein HemY
VRFGLLGPLEIHDGHGRLVRLGAPKQRTLVTVLLLHANRPVPIDYLVEALWPQRPPRRAVGALRTYVSALRQSVGLGDHAGASRITMAAGAYQLTLPGDDLDLKVFERHAAEAAQAMADGKLELAAERFQDAVRLWRGRPLQDVSVPAVLDGELAALEERRLVVLESWAEARLALGRHAELLPELRHLALLEPLRERLWAQLMLALYRSGRQAEALDAYHELRSTLIEELGIEPSPPLQQLQQQILSADPALHPAGRRPATATGAHTTAMAPTAQIPRQLPPTVATFTGRRHELDELEALLTGSGGHPGRPVVISSIDGIGGIGKSALAIHAAHRLAARYPDGCLYVNLHGATTGLAPLNPLEVLGRFLRTLGMPGQDIPTEVDEAAARFRSLVAERRLLMVLDNARDAAQILPLLPASPGCAVLVTSRRVLTGVDGARHLHLDVLTPQEAVTLLAELTGGGRVPTEPHAAQKVARLCGYLPLAVRITGARLAARPGWPVSALANKLASAQHRLDELALGDLGVRTSFRVSYKELQESADRIEREAAKAFGLLGLLDGPDVSAAAAARLLDRAQSEAEDALERLVDAQLLEATSPGRYRMHDLLRLFARERAQADQDEPTRQAALERAFGWYTAVAEHANQLLLPAGLREQTMTCPDGLVLADRRAALGWLEAERANLVAAAQQAAAHPTGSIAKVAWQLSEALWRFFDLRTHWTDWQAVCQAAIQAAERAGEPAAAARALEVLGSIHGRQRRYQDAMECLQRSLAICRQVGDRSIEGKVLNNLGSVHREQGRYQDAIGCYGQSLAIFRQVGDRHCEGKVLNNLGEAYREQGLHQEAIGYYQQDLAICRQLGDAQGEAITLHSLGDVYYAQGRYQDASGCYERALAIARQVGDRLVEAKVLHRRGRVAAAVQDPRAARADWTAALDIFERLGSPEADEVRALLAEQGA